MPLRRTEFIVSGRVQEAGYRYAVYLKSYDQHITGTVENLNDGTVKIVAEGEKTDIEKFQSDIKIDDGLIRVKEEDIHKVNEEEIGQRAHKGFVIKRSWLKEILRLPGKLDQGVYYLRTFQKATTTKFDELNVKYGTVSKHLEQMDKYLEQIAKSNQETSKYQQETSMHLAHLSALVEKIAEERTTGGKG